MSSAVKILPHYTFEDYCLWEGRWELIEGIPYSMSPAPIPQHQNIAGNIFATFKEALKMNGCDCKVYMPIDYLIANDTVLQPDVLIVCTPIQKKFLDFPPTLVVEILSPSTAMNDRNNKFLLYQSEKIPYYLIVDIDKNEVEIYKLDEAGNYISVPHNPAQPFTFYLEDDCHPSVVLNNIWE